jgi:hypothetical protein
MDSLFFIPLVIIGLTLFSTEQLPSLFSKLYYWNRLDSFDIKDDILCRKWESNDSDKIEWQIVIPEKQRSSILKQLHDSVLDWCEIA